jgi:hypothetical protein
VNEPQNLDLDPHSIYESITFDEDLAPWRAELRDDPTPLRRLLQGRSRGFHPPKKRFGRLA